MFDRVFNKSIGEYILIFIIALIILITYYWITGECNIDTKKNAENMINIVQTKPVWQRNQCDYMMNETIIDELNKGGFIQPDSENGWTVYFPCAYDEITKEVSQMPVVNGGKYFILENCDEIVAKELLWKNIVDYFGIDKAKIMMPNSYVLYDDNDMKRFNLEYDSNKLYIIKKNIQRQEGLKITKDKDTILNAYKNDGYVVAQELLQDPYLISGRKTNMRFYVLVVCKGDEYNVFVYNDGFMYYTKNMFVPGSEDDAPNITTGYIDRQVYVDNPLTHKDLKKYLDNDTRLNLLDTEKVIRGQGMRISDIYFNRIYHMLRDVFLAYVGKLAGNPNTRKFNDTNVSFQIFGVDVAVNNKLNPMIMEVNKGPDLGAKDERDSAVKHGLVADTFKVVGLIDGKTFVDTNFIQILETSNGSISSDQAHSCVI